MAGQGFFWKAFNAASNCRLLYNTRSVQITQIAGIRHRFTDRLKELKVPEKPKRPLTSYFKFVQEHRDKIMKQHPEWKVTEVSKQIAADWKSVDPAIKEKYDAEYKAELEVYAAKWLEYTKKLTDEQKVALQEYRKEAHSSKVKRKLKQKSRDHNKPKRPLGAYILFVMEHAKRMNRKYSELLSELKDKWAQLPPEEKARYLETAKNANDQYNKELKKWEEKMIKEGNLDLVRVSSLVGTTAPNPPKEGKSKNKTSTSKTASNPPKEGKPKLKPLTTKTVSKPKEE